MLKKMPWLVMMILSAQLLCADIIEKIQVEGNRKVSRETIQFYMKSREGGVYDPEKLKEDFQALWATGFFENVRIEEENGAGGKIVRLVLVENPLDLLRDLQAEQEGQGKRHHRKAAGRQHPAAAFFLLQPGQGAQGKKDRHRHAPGKGLQPGRGRHRRKGRERADRPDRARQRGLQDAHRQRGLSRPDPGLGFAGIPAPRLEEQPGARHAVRHRRQGRLQPREDQRGHRGGPPAPAAEGLPGSQGRHPGIQHGRQEDGPRPRAADDAAQHPGGARPALPRGHRHHRGQQGHPRRLSAEHGHPEAGPGLQHQEAQQVHRGHSEVLRRHRLFLRPGRARREPGPGQAQRPT